MRWALGIIALGLAGGCDGGPGLDETGFELTVTLDAAPSLFVIRDGEGAVWESPTAASPGRYVVRVHGPYAIVASCYEAADLVEIVEVARVPEDPREFALPCLVPANPETPPPFHVTGAVTRAGFVGLGTQIDSALRDNWSFDVRADHGTFDLVAVSFTGANRIAIRRDLVIAGPTMVMPPIDTFTEGVALAPFPVTVTGLRPEDELSGGLLLRTRSTSISYEQPITDIIGVIPEALLRAGDAQYVQISAQDNDVASAPYRSLRRALVPGASAGFALPAVLDAQVAVVDRQLVASWGTLPELDVLELQGLAVRGSVIVHRALTTRGYLAATGATTAALSTDVPGYRPAWQIDFAGEYSYVLETRAAAPDETVSQLSALVNGP